MELVSTCYLTGPSAALQGPRLFHRRAAFLSETECPPLLFPWTFWAPSVVTRKACPHNYDSSTNTLEYYSWEADIRSSQDPRPFIELWNDLLRSQYPTSRTRRIQSTVAHPLSMRTILTVSTSPLCLGVLSDFFTWIFDASSAKMLNVQRISVPWYYQEYKSRSSSLCTHLSPCPSELRAFC
jgi:hypothetical protein